MPLTAEKIDRFKAAYPQARSARQAALDAGWSKAEANQYARSVALAAGLPDKPMFAPTSRAWRVNSPAAINEAEAMLSPLAARYGVTVVQIANAVRSRAEYRAKRSGIAKAEG